MRAMRRAQPFPLVLALLLGGLASLTGCVERKMVIVSDPPGAEVYIDYSYAGTTPLTFPFTFYGTHDILVRHPGDPDGGADAPVYRSSLQKFTLRPPWYQYVFIDFFAEHLWPGTLVDEHRLEVALDTLGPRTPDKIRAVESRAKAFRDTAEELAENDPQGHTNPPPAPPNQPLEFDGEANGTPADGTQAAEDAAEQ